MQVQEEFDTVVPIAVLRHSDVDSQAVRKSGTGSPAGTNVKFATNSSMILDSKHVYRCLNAGAVDVLTSPLDLSRVHGLIIHAYRAEKSAQKEKHRFLTNRKLRKQSWVGADDQQPFSYLRESM